MKTDSLWSSHRIFLVSCSNFQMHRVMCYFPILYLLIYSYNYLSLCSDDVGVQGRRCCFGIRSPIQRVVAVMVGGRQQRSARKSVDVGRTIDGGGSGLLTSGLWRQRHLLRWNNASLMRWSAVIYDYNFVFHPINTKMQTRDAVSANGVAFLLIK